MSVTRTTVLIGIMCSVWMTFPLTANAFDLAEFVGLTDRGSTKVKACADGKRGRARFFNSTESKVGLRIALSDDPLVGDDGIDGDDPFIAFFHYDGVPETRLSRGVWSKIDERKNGRETYQLTPSGDLTEDAAPGWEQLLTLMSNEAADACLNTPPAQVYEALSDLVKGTLVVEDKDPCDSRTVPDGIDCEGRCAGASCRKAKVNLDVKAFMNNGDTDTAAEVKTDLVRFRYTAKGYVVVIP